MSLRQNNKVLILHQFKWGRIDIRFSKPYSLNAYIKSQIKRRGSEFNPANVVDDKILLLQTLGYRCVPTMNLVEGFVLIAYTKRILSDINAASVIMPTALGKSLFLNIQFFFPEQLTQTFSWHDTAYTSWQRSRSHRGT